MATLSPTQLARIRRQSGDTGTPPDIADADIQAIYDDTDLGNSNIDRTTYYVIRDRKAKAATDILTLSDSGSGMSYSNAKYNNLSKMLEDWGKVVGITPQPTAGTLVMGSIGLDIDTTCDDLEDIWP